MTWVMVGKDARRVKPGLRCRRRRMGEVNRKKLKSTEESVLISALPLTACHSQSERVYQREKGEDPF